MIFDWRSRRYRGGSRWASAGLVVVMVGMPLVEDIPVGAVLDTSVAEYQTALPTGTAEYQTVLSTSTAEWG